ncbi:MAG: beta-lactamase family protein [Abditibacteriales bacterium]|nr:beta-lactamase family protein [Abditibacteriales bacterium]MDW8366224.1 hypothetical protein [Abditibacteriales bacterium]
MARQFDTCASLGRGDGSDVALERHAGYLRLPNRLSAAPDTFFDLASLTRLLACAAVILWLAQRKLSLP